MFGGGPPDIPPVPPARNPPPASPALPPPGRQSQTVGEAGRSTRQRLERRGAQSTTRTRGGAAGISDPVTPARKRLLGE